MSSLVLPFKQLVRTYTLKNDAKANIFIQEVLIEFGLSLKIAI